MYFRGPHGRLALPNESPSLNKANLLTYLPFLTLRLHVEHLTLRLYIFYSFLHVSVSRLMLKLMSLHCVNLWPSYHET